VRRMTHFGSRIVRTIVEAIVEAISLTLSLAVVSSRAAAASGSPELNAALFAAPALRLMCELGRAV